jgi:methionyl-tRNA formyltransferase
MYDFDTLDEPIPVNLPWVFFGTDTFSVGVATELKREGLTPELVVCPPDRPKGRNQEMTPPPIKLWALENKIPVFQPEKLDTVARTELQKKSYDFFVVASYGKLLPKAVLSIPKHGVLNVHPSLLPKYRGPSPIEAQILHDDKEVGVSIMLLDEGMDSGPILAQEKIHERALPMPAPVLMRLLADIGGRLLAHSINPYISGELTPEPQNSDKATICKMIKKEDGEIKLEDDGRKNYLKYLAYQDWPGTYFFTTRKDKPVRVIVKQAFWENNSFQIKRVLPEGGREMDYTDFLRGN